MGLLDGFSYVIGVVWLFFVLCLAQGYTSLKIILLAILCLLSLINISRKRISIKKNYIAATIGIIVFFIFSLSYGILSGYEFDDKDFALIQNYVFTPICALFLGYLCYDDKKNLLLKKSLIVFGAIISVFDILCLVSYMGFFPHLFVFDLIKITNIEFGSGGLRMRVTNEEALMFLTPYAITLLPYVKEEKNKLIRLCIFISSIGGTLQSIISGRRALEICIAFSFVFAILCTRKARGSNLRKIVYVIVIILILVFALNLLSVIFQTDDIIGTLIDHMMNIFSSSGGESKRKESMRFLFTGWIMDPGTFFLGNGLNSYSTELIANAVTKWSYEVFYSAFLFQTGIFGFMILGSVILSFFRSIHTSYKQTSDVYDLAMMIGMICFCFASATNPMFYYVWFWGIMWSEKITSDKRLLSKTIIYGE